MSAPTARSSQQSATARGAWFAVAFAVFTVAWGGNEFTPLLVMYRNAGDFSPIAADALLGAYVFGIIPALLIGGPLSDRYGRRPLLLPAVPLSFVGSLAIAAAPGSVLLVGAGRVLCGLALGLAMAVGAAWIAELSAGADAGAGPRRSSLSLTTGFLAGAVVASVLAQWAPWPAHLSYLIHAGLAVVAGLLLLRAPETHASAAQPERGSGEADGGVPETSGAARSGGLRGLLADLRVPAAAHKRFLFVVVPVAPWVFGCASTAYAVLPGLMSEHSGGVPIAFSGLMTAVGLSTGTLVQMLGKRIDTHRSARASAVAMVMVVAGMVLAAVASSALTLPLALISAAVLGAGYGLAMIAGLSEVQRIAGADDLAGLTSVFYSLSYLGFFAPVVLTALSAEFSFTQLFITGAVIACPCAVIVCCAWRAHLPMRSRQVVSEQD